MATTYTVQIAECRSGGRTWETRVRATDEHDARQRAATKLFGRQCFWQRDSGLGDAWGQVFRGSAHDGATSMTSRCHASVTRGGGR